MALTGLLQTPGYGSYLFDTGPPDTSSGWYGYDLKSDRPIIAVKFSNATAWDIWGIEGYFSSILNRSYLQAVIWTDNGTIPGSVQFSSAPTNVQGLMDWRGASGLDWSLEPGTWWVGFLFNSGDPAILIAGAPGVPDNPLREAQLNNGTWYSYVNTYHLSFRIASEPPPAPLPSAVCLLGSGLVGLLVWRRFRERIATRE